MIDEFLSIQVGPFIFHSFIYFYLFIYLFIYSFHLYIYTFHLYINLLIDCFWLID